MLESRPNHKTIEQTIASLSTLFSSNSKIYDWYLVCMEPWGGGVRKLELVTENVPI